MTTPATTRGRRAPERPLKSPLAVAGDRAASAAAPAADAATSVLEDVVLSDRAATLAEFEDFLQTANNRDGRPFGEATINAYVSPGKNLDAWLTAKEIASPRRPGRRRAGRGGRGAAVGRQSRRSRRLDRDTAE